MLAVLPPPLRKQQLMTEHFPQPYIIPEMSGREAMGTAEFGLSIPRFMAFPALKET